jgi:AcrR family transcriptional regulator
MDAFERRVEIDGYDRANLDDVARELKISKKTIYVHFDGKRDIYAHVVARTAQRMKAQLAASVAPLPTFRQRVEAAVRSLLDEYEIAADAFRKANGDLLRELVQGGMDAGELRTGDASLVERMVTAMIVEYLVLVNADPSYDRDTELLERIVEFVS